MILAVVMLVVSQDAAAHAQLRPLEKQGQQLVLRVEPGKSNLLSNTAVRELKRWPEAPQIVLHPPLTKAEARQLRKLGRFIAVLPLPLFGAASLKLAAPALTAKVELQPVVERPRSEWPCPDAPLYDEHDGTAPVLRANGGVTACVRKYLEAQGRPRPEEPDLLQEQREAIEKVAPARNAPKAP